MIHGNRHHGNVDDHLARSFAVKPAPSARRYAALGLDRSLQPSKLADHAFDAALSTESTNLNPTFTEISYTNYLTLPPQMKKQLCCVTPTRHARAARLQDR